MKNGLFEYKGYYGSANVSIPDNVLHGKVLYINDLVTYEADSVSELEAAFREEVDDYLEFCEAHGKEPDKPFKGSFNVRISPELHRNSAILAAEQGKTLNQFVAECISAQIAEASKVSLEEIDEKLNVLSSSIQNYNNNASALIACVFTKNLSWLKGGEAVNVGSE